MIGYKAIKSIMKKLVRYLKAIFFLLKTSFLLWLIKEIQKVMIMSKMKKIEKKMSNTIENGVYMSNAYIGKNMTK